MTTGYIPLSTPGGYLVLSAPMSSGGTALAAGTVSTSAVTTSTLTVSTTAATGGAAPYTYQFQRAPDSSGSPGTWVSIGSSGSSTSFNDTGLSSGTTYWYRVQVTDAASAASNSAAVSVLSSSSDSGPAIPNLAIWESRTLSYAQSYGAVLDALTSSTYNANAHFNHDGAYGALQSLQRFPGNSYLLDYVAQEMRLYRDYYLLGQPTPGAVSGYYVFPEGLGMDWEVNGSTTSRTALIDLRNHGAYVTNNPGGLSHEGGSRETAYALLTQVEADRLGLVAWDTAYVPQLVNYALAQIAWWIGDPGAWVADGSPFIQCFMMGITSIALAKYLDYIEGSKSTTDTRIVPALAALAVRMREQYWRIPTQDYIWYLYSDNYDIHANPDNLVLNEESSNWLGWLYNRTGTPYFQVAGDEAFGAGVAMSSEEFSTPKQYNQMMRWTPLYVAWRQATPGSDNAHYVVDPPYFTNSLSGVVSGNFTVMPLQPYTGTITPACVGLAGTFTPTSLTWSGTNEPKTFKFTPSAAGSGTIRCAASPALGTDPASVTYTGTTAATSYTFAGPTTGVVGLPSTYQITLNGAYTGTFTVTVSGISGALSPPSVILAGTSSAQAISFYPSASGSATISISAYPLLGTDPSPLPFTAS